MQNFVPNAAIATFHNKDILVRGVYDNFAAVSGEPDLRLLRSNVVF